MCIYVYKTFIGEEERIYWCPGCRVDELIEQAEQAAAAEDEVPGVPFGESTRLEEVFIFLCQIL